MQSPLLGAAMSVNIDNFESTEKEIDSPRTIEACLELGVDTSELYPLYGVVNLCLQ